MSFNPVGSTHNGWETAKDFIGSVPIIVVPSSEEPNKICKVPKAQVLSVICHRWSSDHSQEEFLLKWKTPPNAFSWHKLNELTECLFLVQRYIESLPENLTEFPLSDPFELSVKKTLSYRELNREVPSSATSGSPSFSASPVVEEFIDPNASVYNGYLQRDAGRYVMLPMRISDKRFQDTPMPTPDMRKLASHCGVNSARYRIKASFDRKLTNLKPPVRIVNEIDWSRPPLDYEFIDKSIEHPDVRPDNPAFVFGCGGESKAAGQLQRCRPDMGDCMGCQYSRVCECLEFAAVKTTVLTEDEEKAHKMGEFAGLPKRFPYAAPGTRKAGCLSSFYLEQRFPLYECNHICSCGPGCKTRVVQNGRTVGLEIFKTVSRGWGLRCTEDLKEGQFIDTYRGEIIPPKEADLREKAEAEADGIGHGSYLFTLDKFVGNNGLKAEDCYVVDGRNVGGPTRFINHSCDPNCRQFTVSYNKYDIEKYELAFFAIRYIPKGEELTFDYLDKDEGEIEADEEDIPSSQPNRDKQTEIECKCGSKNCRKTLWV